jgi:hypothetical protein
VQECSTGHPRGENWIRRPAGSRASGDLGCFWPIYALPSIVATLISIERDGPCFLEGETNMKFRMDQTLRFWVDCSYEDRKGEKATRTKADLIAEILRDYERCGDAVRHLNANGQIAWKASPVCFRDWPMRNARSRTIWRIVREACG